jgi:hypothetical protein
LTELEQAVLDALPGCRRVREVKSNEGPEINRWLDHVRLPPGHAYCAAMVSCVIDDAARKIGIAPKLNRSGSALRLLDLNPTLEISLTDAMALMRDGRPVVYVIDHGTGKGHTGFACGLVGDECFLDTSGNTMPSKTTPAKDRQGQGVYERSDRRLEDVYGWLQIG